jgi:TatD DNase family protein
MLFDTHAHLDIETFPEGVAAVIERAEAAGVKAFASIGVGSLEHARSAVNLAENTPNVVATVGVHPHDAGTLGSALESDFAPLAEHRRVVAIGEVGLDYHYENSPREVQADVFRRAIALARRLRKPLVIHTRDAAADTLAILREENARDVGGIIHCFSEDESFAKAALELGFYLSFSGILTFKNARSIQAAALFAPEDRLLVETDSPYLAPVPLRGKKCEPAFVVHTARRLAELRGADPAHIGAVTTQNAARVFGLVLKEGMGGGVTLDTERSPDG